MTARASRMIALIGRSSNPSRNHPHENYDLDQSTREQALPLFTHSTQQRDPGHSIP